jgi:CheY-like chemotaxis protein
VRSVPGRGSRFSITVPHVAAQEPAAAEPALPVADGLRGQRVLIIDNDDAVLGSTADLLRSWGCIVHAQHGLGELPDDRHTPLDLLLVDMHLDHGDDGIAAVARLRSLRGHVIPALVMTGDVTVATRERLAAAGLPSLEKPLTALRLRSALTRLLQRG